MKDLGTTLFQSVAAQMGKKDFRVLLDQKIKQSTQIRPQTAKVVPATPSAAMLAFPEFGRKAAVKGSPAAPRPHARPPKAGVKIFKVGIWDVNSLIGDLSLVVSTLNGAQLRFRFFEVSGAVPGGLVSDKARVVAWLTQHNRKLTAREKRDIEENTIAEDFYPQALKLRLLMGLDSIVGLTSSMIAFDEGGHIEYNYFASCEDKQKRDLLVSTYDLRKYANMAGRPLEAAIGGVLLSILLVAINPKLGYHENAGCLFDFNEDRDTIVRSLREATIERRCLGLMRPEFREPAEAMVQALKKLRAK
jgi:hypothetical protein